MVCAQNGVENERLALRRFSNVQAMCVFMPTTRILNQVWWSSRLLRSQGSSMSGGTPKGSTT